MNPEQPLVSIIIPTYNRAHLIGETLDSVLAQTYTNWECIVVDDGSTDNTAEVVQSYQDKDTRFYFHQRPQDRPKGANACRNYGFELSKGEYIQWLDSDDLLGSNKIYKQVEVLEKQKGNSVATCKFGYFSEKNKLSVRQGVSTYRNFKNGLELLNQFGKSNEYFPAHVYLAKKTNIEKYGIWDNNVQINQDGVFFTKLLLETDFVVFVDENVYYRKVSSSNTSVMNSLEKAQALINSWEQIEQLIRKKTGRKRSLYVEAAKKIIYKQIIENYPQLITANYSFFKTILPWHKQLFLKFKL